jgi:hypothetical protein
MVLVAMLLLDHDLPHRLRDLLASYGIESETAASRGWERLRNGELVTAAFAAGFEAIYTRDLKFRLNTDLAKKPPQCLEYIVVHEMLYLLEPTHNDRFTNLIDQFMLQWRSYRAELNRLPVRHEEWSY